MTASTAGHQKDTSYMSALKLTTLCLINILGLFWNFLYILKFLVIF